MTFNQVTGSNIWQTWMALDTGTSAAFTSANIWGGWIQQGTIQLTTGAVQTANVWITWNTANVWFDAAVLNPPALTPEQEAEQALLHDWDAAQAEEDRRRRIGAATRARALLRQHLDEAQRRDLESRSCFYVKSQGGRLYKIRHGATHNVLLVDPVSKDELLELCVTAENHYDIPVEDVMLAQKLWLEAHEAETLKKANIWDLKDGRRPLGPREKARLAAA